jgi:hypothetical protein
MEDPGKMALGYGLDRSIARDITGSSPFRISCKLGFTG